MSKRKPDEIKEDDDSNKEKIVHLEGETENSYPASSPENAGKIQNENSKKITECSSRDSKTSSCDKVDRKSRYMHAGVIVGQKNISIVLGTYSQGKINQDFTYRDAVFSYYRHLISIGKTKKTENAQYKHDFSTKERAKLEDPHSNLFTFDVALIFKLLMRMKDLTGFADHDDNVWHIDDPPGRNRTIEHLIHRAKYHRNEAAHLVPVTEDELQERINDLENIFKNVIYKVLSQMKVEYEIVEDKITDIKYDFAYLRDPSSRGFANSKGLVVIFNYVTFNNPELTREGAEKDNITIDDTFKNPIFRDKYKVITCTSYTKEQTLDKFKMLQNELSRDIDSLIIFISSHGKSKHVFLTQDEEMNIEELRKMLYEYDDCCPNLKDKAKVVLANYCQGDDYEFEDHTGLIQGESIVAENAEGVRERIQVARNIKTFYSTSEGVVAWRWEGGGNVFIQTFCEVLNKKPHLELQQLIFEVNDKVEKKIACRSTFSEEGSRFNHFYF